MDYKTAATSASFSNFPDSYPLIHAHRGNLTSTVCSRNIYLSHISPRIYLIDIERALFSRAPFAAYVNLIFGTLYSGLHWPLESGVRRQRTHISHIYVVQQHQSLQAAPIVNKSKHCD